MTWGWDRIPSADLEKEKKPTGEGMSRDYLAGLYKLKSFEHADTVRKIVSIISHLPCSLHTDVFIKVLGTTHYNGVRMFDRASLFTAWEEH